MFTSLIRLLVGLFAIASVATSPSNPDSVRNSVGMTLIKIRPGSFLMGSPLREITIVNHDEVQHRVVLTKGFYIASTDVTVGQFKAFAENSGYLTTAEKVGSAPAWVPVGRHRGWQTVNGASWKNPGFPQRDDHPVVVLTWDDAVAYCAWLSKKEGNHYRLPTEAEWEYCCRAGSQTTYFWGNNPDDGAGYANCWDLSAARAFPERSNDCFKWDDKYVYTSPVATFKPNAWGLYDMIGNAKQWCSDFFDTLPSGKVVDPHGPAQSENGDGEHVARGGSWWDPPKLCRCATRFVPPTAIMAEDGFRVVLDLN
jgi:formylglycine-generating enzyme